MIEQDILQNPDVEGRYRRVQIMMDIDVHLAMYAAAKKERKSIQMIYREAAEEYLTRKNRAKK